jgi:hypothetical protein
MSVIKTRVQKLEQSADASRPLVALVFLNSPDGTPVRVFNSVGAELPADTEWRSQRPAAKVLIGINFDDV